MRMIGQMENGILLYLRQEGRGIGFINKIRAYSLQDSGYDTVQANLALGFRDDEGDYSVAAHMLESLKVKSIRLMTNNPKKMNALTAFGVKITERIPLVIPPNPYNEFYLRTKAEKSGHMISFGKDMRFYEQIDRPVVDGMTREQIVAWHDDECDEEAAG
jgi:GTP cyclohydrolase II